MFTKIEFDFECSPEELQEAVEAAERDNSSLLRGLCQKEIDRFDQYLSNFGSQATNDVDRDWVYGLSRWERRVLEGYLYQKIRGHIDAKVSQSNIDSGRKNGTPTSA